MEAKMNGLNGTQSYAMNGGSGTQSYANNSSFQRGVVDATKLLLEKAISEHLNPENFPALETFYIADLGCSIGPNTFISMQNIIDAVKLKYQSNTNNDHIKTPEFQVLFNDHSVNDFNTLFKSLPLNREYYASGVPGSFYTQLFPNKSLHFVHTSITIHWMSRVPKEITTLNKGRVHYGGAGEEVIMAYSKKHAEDFTNFLEARAHELVPGGLVVFVTPVRNNEVSHSECSVNKVWEIFSSSLRDLAKKGVIDEEKIDAINIPIYHASPKELEATIKQNGSFSIEKFENLPKLTTTEDPRAASLGLRAVAEALLKEHFDEKTIDAIFEAYTNKLTEGSLRDIRPGIADILFAVLKRKD